jgi:Uma2 family endonuclease
MAGTTSKVLFEDVGELLARLGHIPARRICLHPAPGTATEQDLLRKHGRPRKLFELIDGTLVEKPMGSRESHLASRLIGRLEIHLDDHDVGFLYAPDALIEVLPKLVRGPDVSFMAWRKGSARAVPQEQISTQVPDLAVEILSPSNTRKEMQIKLKEYFLGGVKLVWIIDPKTRTAAAHTAPDVKVDVSASGTLDGGTVLPGFRLPLAKLFEKFPAPPAPKKKPSKRKPK